MADIDNEKRTEGEFALSPKNFLFVLAGFVVMLVGYALMSGGGSADPQEFNPEIFSFRRIVLAPVVIVAGIVIEIVAIMKVFKR